MENTASKNRITLASLGMCMLCAALVVLGTACPTPTPEPKPTPDCTSDDDCTGDQVCNIVTGDCEEPTPPGCTIDDECGDNEFCDETGTCVGNANLYGTTAFDADFDRVHPLHTNCAGCHHVAIPTEPGTGSCRTCHSDDPNVANSFKEVAHDQNESGDGCRQCHDADWSDCSFCHTALDGL